MTIDEAIERDEAIIIKGELGDVLTAYPAIQLGIEALKRIQHIGTLTAYELQLPLPGETKD